MQEPAAKSGHSRLVTLAALALVLAGLYVARDLLIPLALATLLSFLLSPLAERLERLGLGRIPAVMIVCVIALTPLVVLGWILVMQFIDLATMLPMYRANIEQRIESLTGPAGGVLERMTGMVRELGVGTQPPAVPEPGEVEPPVPVRVVQPPASPVEVARAIFGPLARPLAVVGIVLVFVIFMLIQREDLRDRIIRLISEGRLTVTTQAMSEIAERVSRYLRMQLLLNTAYGVVAALGLLLIGVPNALLWGLLSIGLRFIPYAGPILSAALPIAVSFAVSEGWTAPLLTIGLYIVLESVSSYVFEPWLYGLSTGVSTLSLLVAAIFWTWLWGVPGLLLSTPMTVCLVVAGRYVPQLNFLNILLRAEGVMEPKARVYQRLLAGDEEEAAEVAGEYLAGHTLEETYDDLLIPALRQADEDAEEGLVNPVRQRAIHESIRLLVAELARTSSETLAGRAGGNPQAAAAKRASPIVGQKLLCIPARDEADVVAAEMVGALLSEFGVVVEIMDLDDLGSDLATILNESRPSVVCISAVPPFAATQARLRLRQLLLRAPGTPTAVGLWGVVVETAQSTMRLKGAGAEAVVFSLGEGVDKLQAMLRARAPGAVEPLQSPPQTGGASGKGEGDETEGFGPGSAPRRDVL